MVYRPHMLFIVMVSCLASRCAAYWTCVSIDYIMKETYTAALTLFIVGLAMAICWILVSLSSFHPLIRERLSFGDQLKRSGYSKEAVDEIWKWYDFSERKGVANW